MRPILTAEDLERLARRRAGAKMGWYLHAAVYLAVNCALLLASTLSGRHWAVYPALAWGTGLLIHGAAVWLAASGGGLHNHLLEKERARLRQLHDAW